MAATQQTTILSDDDDDEYLDELVSDEDESEDDNVKPVVTPVNRILKGKLPPPRNHPLSTKQIHEMIHYGNVDLNPDYQRDVVWNPVKMIMLIQSLFLNYYVPPIIFAVSTNHDNGEEIRIAIDGKQRCTSIMWFIDGKIPFVSPHTKERFWYTFAPGVSKRHGKQLPSNLKRIFDTISIQCVEYDNIGEETQRDIFQRVQLGMALNTSEKLAAIPGPWSKWIISLQKRYVDGDDGLGGLLDWDIKRSLPFKTLASVIVLALEDLRRPPSAPYLTNFLDRSDGPPESFQRKMTTTLALFVNIATDHHHTAFESVSNRRIAPVEFWFICLVIFRFMGSMSISQLAKTIGDMRKLVRSKHKDVFSNNKVVATLFEWLDNLEPGKGEQAAAEEWAIEDAENVESLARKRKRERREEQDDPDFEGPAVPRGVYSAPTENLRSRAKAVRPPVETTPASRPPPPSMDAPATNPYGGPVPAHANNSFTAPSSNSHGGAYGYVVQPRPDLVQQQAMRSQQFAQQFRPAPPNPYDNGYGMNGAHPHGR